MTVPGKGGRPKTGRVKWQVMLFLQPDERATIEAAAQAAGVSVARYLLDAALARAATLPKETP